MSPAELRDEYTDGVLCWVAEEERNLSGVRGIQDLCEVALARNTYVLPARQEVHRCKTAALR